MTDAVVRYDGSVTWIRPVIYTVTSRHEFRSNSWSAILKFASWSYDATLLDLQPLPDSSVGRRRGRSLSSNDIDSEQVRMDTSNFEPSDLWGLLENRGRLEARTSVDLTWFAVPRLQTCQSWWSLLIMDVYTEHTWKDFGRIPLVETRFPSKQLIFCRQSLHKQCLSPFSLSKHLTSCFVTV